MTKKDFCDCASCAELMERAYLMARGLLHDQLCPVALVGLGHALTSIGATMVRGEMMGHAVRLDGLKPTRDLLEQMNEATAHCVETKTDIIADHIETDTKFEARCHSIYHQECKDTSERLH